MPTPTHAPATQASLEVHALPSSHAAPSPTKPLFGHDAAAPVHVSWTSHAPAAAPPKIDYTAMQHSDSPFRPATVPPRFAVGAAVMARNFHPPGHTRLPRYARGKRGVIAAQRGCHLFPDTHAHGLGEAPQHVYGVRFDARELWGEAAEPRQAVYLDLWESYLEPA